MRCFIPRCFCFGFGKRVCTGVGYGDAGECIDFILTYKSTVISLRIAFIGYGTLQLFPELIQQVRIAT